MSYFNKYLVPEETLGSGGRGAVPDVVTGWTETHHFAEVRGGDNALFAAALRAEDVPDLWLLR